MHERVFGSEFATHHYDKSCFEGIYNVSDEEVWYIKKGLKAKLMYFVRERLQDKAISNHYSPTEIVTILENLRDDVLTIGFARRFATYKRATLLFPRIPVSSARSCSCPDTTSRWPSAWSRAWMCG